MVVNLEGSLHPWEHFGPACQPEPSALDERLFLQQQLALFRQQDIPDSGRLSAGRKKTAACEQRSPSDSTTAVRPDIIPCG